MSKEMTSRAAGNASRNEFLRFVPAASHPNGFSRQLYGDNVRNPIMSNKNSEDYILGM